jgi:amino acid adenylation domain-containing protein
MQQGSARDATARLAPLSPYQQRVWYLQQLTQLAGLLHVSKAFRLVGRLDRAVLQRALNDVVNRHDILRTCFVVERDAVGQSTAGYVDCALSVEGLSTPTLSDGDVQSWLRSGARSHIDLTAAPLLRCRLLRLADDRHVLFLTAHLLVCDEASLDVLMSQLRETYSAMLMGRKPALAPTEAGYFAYSAGQQSSLLDGALVEQLDRCAKSLAGAPLITSPLGDRARAIIPSYRAGTVTRVLHRLSVGDVAAAEQRLAAHRSLILLAAYFVLLHRYTEQADLVVGIKVDPRGISVDRAVIGPLEDTLPLRVDMTPGDSFEHVVRKLQARSVSAMEYRSVPFKNIVDACALDKVLGRAPIYQTLFSFGEVGSRLDDFGGLQIEEVAAGEDLELLDLSVRVAMANDAVSLSAKYSTDMFDRDTIERLMEHFEILLESVLANVQTPIGDARLMSDSEVQRLLYDWNATSRDWAEPAQTVAQLIVRHGESTKSAVVDGSRSFSYADIVRRAARYCNALRSDGVGPGDVVGISMDRSAELVVAMLGCLMARAAYLPLDATLPSHRIAMMVEAAGAKVVLSTESNRARLAGIGARLVVADSDGWRRRIDESSNEVSVAEGSGADPAYVIFTSGSTGTPKGVRVLNASVVNLIHGLAEIVGPRESDRVMAHTTLSFDIHVLETLAALAAHATMYMASAHESEDAKAFGNIVEREGVTFLQCTPARWQQLEASGWVGKSHLKALVGGEALSAEVARFITTRSQSAWNLYGPTETTVWSTCAPLGREAERPSIGRPIANTRVYVLDPRRKLVPVGVAGELYIAGAGVSAGYLGDSDLTRSRFLDISLTPHLSERAYKTGDLVRYRPDGHLQFIERVDTQVKLRGFRIELTEIEDAIGRLDSVESCAVVVSGREDRRLVAFVIPKARQEFSVVATRKTLREVLPSYMLPQHYQVVTSFPTTPNGKLNRKRLAEIGTAGVKPADHRTQPSTATEARMAGLWRDLIGIDHVFAEDNFLDVGGHSLLSVTFIARWKRETGVNLSPRDVVLSDLANLAKLSDNASSR